MITQHQLKELFLYDANTGLFHRKIAAGRRGQKGALVGTKRHGYLVVKINGKKYSLHRLAWFYVYGELPDGDLDHKNRNPSDNRIDNLRIATRSQNLANTDGQPGRRRSPSKGIHWDSRLRKWIAQINKDRRRFHLGCFKFKADAQIAYANAAKKFYGDFARISSVIFLLLMTSCAPTLSSVNREGAVRIAQAAFKPITWSVDDTAPTVRQIKIHNAVGVKIGLWKYPKVRRHRPLISKIAAPAPLPVEKPKVAPAKKRWWQRK